jgi:hypothetical protein
MNKEVSFDEYYVELWLTAKYDIRVSGQLIQFVAMTHNGEGFIVAIVEYKENYFKVPIENLEYEGKIYADEPL